MLRSLFCCTVLVVLSTSLANTVAEDWAGWRGPQQNGHSVATNLPVEWSAQDVTWKVNLKGEGQSSPVMAGEKIFLTAALEKGRQRIVFCLDRNGGRELWSHVAWTGEPEPSHKMNGWASATCVTDGERIYAFFGRGGGLFCYSVDGKLLWQKELGLFDSPWGTAACPLIVGDLVIQNCDADSDAYIVAFNKKTGEEAWKTKREDARGWSSPIVVRAAGRDEVVVNGHHGVRGYDPASGKELWFCKGFAGRGTPTVTPAGDLLHVVCGLKGDTYAVKPGGNGDVTATHMQWHSARKSSRDLPSPIVIGDQSLVMDMRTAILTSYDIENGSEKWRNRIGDAGGLGQLCATPVSWNGVAFFVAESGKTVAIRPGEKMKIVAVNEVGAEESEIFRASITPSEGQLFLRSNRVLYCIGQRTK